MKVLLVFSCQLAFVCSVCVVGPDLNELAVKQLEAILPALAHAVGVFVITCRLIRFQGLSWQ